MSQSLTEKLKSSYLSELQIDDNKTWEEEWIRTTNLQYKILKEHGFEGVKLVEQLSENAFELGNFPEDCPWYRHNKLSKEKAVKAIFKDIADEIPQLMDLLLDSCLHIYTEKKEGTWYLHYLVKNILHDHRQHFVVLTGGSPLSSPKENENLKNYKWKLPQDLKRLYAIHNGFGDAETGIHSNEQLRVMATYMDPICKELNTSPEDYVFSDLLEIAADYAGNYTCFLREEGEEDAVEVVDWDHEVWETSSMGDLFTILDEVVSRVNEADEEDDTEYHQYETTGVEFIDTLINNINEKEAVIIEKLSNLLAKGEEIDQRDNNGKTALMWAIEIFLDETVDFLIEKGADINAKDNNGRTPLLWAALKQCEDIVMRLLDYDVLIEEQDNDGNNALMLAAMNNNDDIATELMENGANINLKNKEGKTALDLAKEHRSWDVISLLDENEEDEDTPEGIVFEDDFDEYDNYAEQLCGIEIIDTILRNVREDEEKIIKALEELLNKGQDINKKSKEGITALYWAIAANLYKTVQYLIEKGADIHVRNKFTAVPLFWAADRGRIEILKLLLDKGADVNAQDEDGTTALMLASSLGNYDTVKELIARGADLNIETLDGDTALSLAEQNLYPKIKKLLEDSGAIPQEKKRKQQIVKIADDDDDLDKYILKPFKGEYIEFKDFNFKLAVIQVLMFEKEVLTPLFDVFEFADLYQGREIDVEEEGYDFIPEIKQYFQELKIDKKFAPLITELFQDGGNDIYGEVIPFWDGEDDVFNIQSTEDAKNFPNLKKVTLFYEKEPKVKNQFEKLGIEVDYL